MKWKTSTRTVITGAIVICTLFLLGVGTLVWLNTTAASSQFRDVGLIFGAAIAATGAIVAAFIAFQASHHLEGEKDLRERRRKIDDERTKTEAAIVTLHVAATFMDRIYKQVRDCNEQAKRALEQKDFSGYRNSVEAMPDIPNPFPLISDLDVRFMRVEEQRGIRNIQVCLELQERSVKAIKSDIRLGKLDQKKLLAALGEDGFFGALGHQSREVEQHNKMLFEAIVPYINARKAAAIPDESKLRMLLGDLRGDDEIPITSLDEALEKIRMLASRLLREHVAANNVRSLMHTVADGIKDEDSIPST